jgi:hypothetical protein
MGRRGTWFVGIAVAVIAVAAIVDALRGDGEPTAASQPAPTTSTSTEPRSDARPIVDGVPGGVLYYTDDDCTLKAARLPTLLGVGAPSWHACRFVLSPDATSVSAPPSGWDPVGDFLFRVEKGWIFVTSGHEPYGPRVAGTAAAWRPDGTLTYVADGAVRAWPGGRVLLSQDDFAAAVRAHPLVPDHGHVLPVTVRELGWLDAQHAVVILEGAISGPRQTLLAIYEGHRLVRMQFGDKARLSGLHISPRGGLIGLGVGDDFVLLNRRGDALQAPFLTGYRSVAWSWDDRWAAVATDAGVVVFRTRDGRGERRLPIVARDLAWRGSSTPQSVEQDAKTRAAVGGLAATGRLLVTLPEAGGCTLRAIELPSLRWAEHPPGRPSACRFGVDEDGAVLDDATVPEPGGGRRTAACARSRDVTTVTENEVVYTLRGCAPAWTPDGRLTFIRDGELFLRGSGLVQQRLLSRQRLGELFGRPSALEEVAWRDDDLFWAVVRSGDRTTVALMTTDGTLLEAAPLDARVNEGLRASTGMVAARTERGVVFFNQGARRALTVPKGWAVAWQPGGDLAAVATPTELLLVSPVTGATVSLPLAARDVEWVEGEP